MRAKKVYRLLISGPSAVGKGVVIMRLLGLLTERGKRARLTVSYITRPIRLREKDGREYHFVTKEVFEEMAKSDKFAEVNTYSENWYGTPSESLIPLPDDDVIVTELDVNGAKNLRRYYRNEGIPYRSLYILPEGRSTSERLQTLQGCLERRGDNDAEDIQRRLAIAKKELSPSVFRSFSEHFINRYVEEDSERGLAAAKGIVEYLEHEHILN